MWRSRWLEHIEIAKQTTCCADTGSIGCFDPEGFQRAHAKSIGKLIAAEIGVEVRVIPYHHGYSTAGQLQRARQVGEG